MKKILLSITLLLGLLLPTNVFAQNIKIVVNNQEVQSDVAPYIENRRTMVPVRVITEYLGGQVDFMEREPDEYYGYQYLDVYSDDPTDLGLTLIINKKIALISEGTFRMDTAPTIKSNRTFVPLRFLADYLNFDVIWDDATHSIYISPTKNINSDNNNFDSYYDENAGMKLEDWLINPSKTNFEKIFNLKQ